MTRLKRRLQLSATLIALILLGVGGWVYHTIYRSSNFALRHAEADVMEALADMHTVSVASD